MNLLSILALLLGGAILFLLLRFWHYFQKERLRRVWLEDHMTRIDRGIERLAEEDPSLVAAPSHTSPSPEMRKLWGDPPEPEQVLEEIFASEAAGGGWDYEVHLHEGAEAYLGTAEFDQLTQRFASIPGVETCRHEDREIFRIRARGLSSEDLKKLIWAQFLKAAAGEQEA